MDDGCCAVCAEAVEWVAYGPCGHRDVCATCIARLRFVCHDLRCCICKSLSPLVFFTKALGSFTRVINDFSILPADAKDGKVGSYWFDEAIQAYFDDFDEYKAIKAMCRLSCSFCDKFEAEARRTSKRRGKFRSIEQLTDHLSRQHELFFCSLCLEHKKVFICEQKLYTQVQLRRHIKVGDSEVDGDENERCGFSGHPICEFCQTPFYGDNELYFHMSTEHFTCHICQRQHPGKYEYYKDYDNLENHFRRAHFLCEDDSCLEKKFVVFASEADLKRHNALEHGGNMPRSRRNAALQLPTCFRYREREENARRIRAHRSDRGVSDHQFPSTIPARAGGTYSDLLRDVSTLQVVPGGHRTGETGSSSDHMPSSEQVQGTASDFRSVLMRGSAFPPLPRTSKRRRRKPKKNSEATSAKTAVCSSSTGSSATNGSSLATPAANRTISSSTSSSSQPRGSSLTPTSNGIALASSANLLRNVGHNSGVGSSSSAQNLVGLGYVGPSACSEPAQKAKGVDAEMTNKSLVEAIRAALEFDKVKFSIFKIISKEYREGVIDAAEFLAHVHQFGLAHLILDLARLCPDPQKQKELMEVHQTCLGDTKRNGPSRESGKSGSSKGSKKGKEKCEDTGSSSKVEASPDKIANLVKELKLDKPYKGPSQSTESRKDIALSNGSGSSGLERATATGTKKKTKKSKFNRNHLGESSASSASDLNCSDLASDSMMNGPNQDSILAAVRGVWQNGGGRRLVALSQASPMTR